MGDIMCFLKLKPDGAVEMYIRKEKRGVTMFHVEHSKKNFAKCDAKYYKNAGFR